MSPAYVPQPTVARQAPRTFEELARLEEAEMDVLTGALFIAEDFSAVHGRAESTRTAIDELAKPLSIVEWGPRSLEEQASALREELAHRAGFAGNEEEFYDPRNSFLPDVIERRRGIPITLSLVYMEVAKRAGIFARGIGFPGHFLVRLDRPGETEEPFIIDPFFGGRVATTAILLELLSRTGTPATEVPPSLLAPVSARSILQRMLMNLRNIFLQRGELGKALLVVDRVLSLSPSLTEAVFDRALISERLGLSRGARASFEEYLRLAPEGPHRPKAEERLAILRDQSPRPN